MLCWHMRFWHMLYIVIFEPCIISMKEINEDDENGEKGVANSPELCTICFEHVNQNRKWNAFHPCGHRSCSECFKDLFQNEDGNKLCPICRAEITMTLTLEGIY